mgnify:CR=1 FL=1
MYKIKINKWLEKINSNNINIPNDIVDYMDVSKTKQNIKLYISNMLTINKLMNNNKFVKSDVMVYFVVVVFNNFELTLLNEVVT